MPVPDAWQDRTPAALLKAKRRRVCKVNYGPALRSTLAVAQKIGVQQR